MTTPWNALYAIDILAIACFAVSYYRKCYRQGYRIDFWYAELFLLCIFPNMIMLPFARNELNAIVLGKDMDAVVAVLPTVFLITLLGYFAILAGGGLWRLQVGVGARKAASKVLNIVPQASMMLMSSRTILVFQSALCMLLQAMILALYFSQSGFAFDLRGYTFANPSLRPVALTISNYSVIIASHCLARYIDKKERILLFLYFVLDLRADVLRRPRQHSRYLHECAALLPGKASPADQSISDLRHRCWHPGGRLLSRKRSGRRILTGRFLWIIGFPFVLWK